MSAEDTAPKNATVKTAAIAETNTARLYVWTINVGVEIILTSIADSAALFNPNAPHQRQRLSEAARARLRRADEYGRFLNDHLPAS